MDQELSALEKKVDALVVQLETLRAENLRLRERVSALEVDNRKLSGKIEAATERIESALAMIPEGTEL
ncbi:cell division protein ZapB [Niveibacterium sp. SC-1]|uniref:cell division protein ZapB n=1 Tax=Niveibacterium sp. SC-1 TaxID=3135646 RepID=UPI00311ED364